MVKLICKEDCQNAPKKQYVLDFTVAFADNDIHAILDRLDETVTWHMVGNKTVNGIEAVRTELEAMLLEPAEVLRIHNILSHGKLCAVHGELQYQNGVLGFCDIHEFSSTGKTAKIAMMTSYASTIPLPSEPEAVA